MVESVDMDMDMDMSRVLVTGTRTGTGTGGTSTGVVHMQRWELFSDTDTCLLRGPPPRSPANSLSSWFRFGVSCWLD